ncbi:MAG: Uma2 family endonuclease, partial [Planctomycetaceae bacterium]|nr:Uma2 family endonuclease [Planctomycetaceae bacterium]
HHTRDADEGQKLRRYAEVGVPVYWILYAKRREVRVYSQPQGGGELAHYGECAAFTQGDDIPIVIDGQEVGRAAVTDLFPPERTP